MYDGRHKMGQGNLSWGQPLKEPVILRKDKEKILMLINIFTFVNIVKLVKCSS